MLYDATHGDVSSVKNISTEGAIILVTSIWNCNLDRSEDSMYTVHGVYEIIIGPLCLAQGAIPNGFLNASTVRIRQSVRASISEQ